MSSIAVAESHPAVVCELAPGVTSISLAVRRGPELSWVPPDATGWEAAHVYVRRHAGRTWLIDTGCAAHGPAIARALRAVMAPGERAGVVLTRIEPDCLGNAMRLIDDGVVDELASESPFDLRELLELAPGQTVRYRRLSLGANAALGLEVCRPPLRTLATTWLWDAALGALWCSDAFGWAGTELPDKQPLVGQVGASVASSEWARDPWRFLTAKFDWLADADRGRVAAEIAEFFAARKPRLLLPTHGSAVEGAAARRMIDALPALLRER